MQRQRADAAGLSRVPPLALAATVRPRPCYRAARLAVGTILALLLGGIVGVAGLFVVQAHRRWHPPTSRRRGIERLAATFAVVVMIVGGYARTRVAMAHIERCPQFAGVDQLLDADRTASNVENALTWAPSGLAIIDVWATSGRVCRVPVYNSYVGMDARFYGRRAVSIGSVYLLRKPNPNKPPATAARVAALTTHEERHRGQWAVATVIGGPLAFPAAYAAAESVFPGARNPFERAANLRDGGYNPTIPEAPHPQPDQIALLLSPGALLEALSLGGRVRRRNARRPGRGT